MRKPRLRRLRDKAGRIKRKAMFAKLRQARHLRTENDATGITIGFSGRIACVASGSSEYKYPARVLLGFTNEGREMIHNILLERIMK